MATRARMQAQESREHGIPPMEVCHTIVTYVPLFMPSRIVTANASSLRHAVMLNTEVCDPTHGLGGPRKSTTPPGHRHGFRRDPTRPPVGLPTRKGDHGLPLASFPPAVNYYYADLRASIGSRYAALLAG